MGGIIVKDLFRKSSLEKLSSPEQLDKTIVITSSFSWIAIIGIFLIIAAFISWSVFGTLPTTIAAVGVLVNGKDVISIHSEYSGILNNYNVKIGDYVYKGNAIAELSEPSGTSITVPSTQDGIVTKLNYSQGEMVNKYDELINLSPLAKYDSDILICYIPIEKGKTVREGMKAIVTPVSVNGQKTGHMNAQVISVDDYVTSIEDIEAALGHNSELINMLVENTALVSVILDITKDSNTTSGYYWTSEKGANIEITAGTICNIQIVTSESAPIAKLFPMFYNPEGEV